MLRVVTRAVSGTRLAHERGVPLLTGGVFVTCWTGCAARQGQMVFAHEGSFLPCSKMAVEATWLLTKYFFGAFFF